MNVLSSEEIKEKLSKLEVEWTVVSDAQLIRVFNFDDFKQALEFSVYVGELAEKANHHPEICIEWGKATITLSTHSVGGLTDADFDLAEQIKVT